jgi:hypothetical protein
MSGPDGVKWGDGMGETKGWNEKKKNWINSNSDRELCNGEDAALGAREGGWVGGVRGWPDPWGRCTRTPDPGSRHTPTRGWQGELGVWTRMDGGRPYKIYSMVNLYLL